MSTTSNELLQNINVMRGLLDLLTKDAETLTEYLRTTTDNETTQKVVRERFSSRLQESLHRAEIIMTRMAYHSSALTGTPPTAL